MGRESFPLLKYLVVATTVLFSSRIFAANKPLAIRGTAGSLPFHLGTTLYNGAWEGFASNDHSTDWWWYDKEYWRNLFQRYEQAHLNTIVYWHPHPFVGFVKLDKYPEAAYLSPKEIDTEIEMFRWITAEGKRHGLGIYFLTWNVCLPVRPITWQSLGQMCQLQGSIHVMRFPSYFAPIQTWKDLSPWQPNYPLDVPTSS